MEMVVTVCHSQVKMSKTFLFLILFMCEVAMLPSITVAPVSILPPYASIANPFRFRGDFSTSSKEGGLPGSGKETGTDHFPEDVADNDDCRRNAGTAEDNDSFNDRIIRWQSEIGVDFRRSGEQNLKDPGGQSSEFVFVMSRPGYTYRAPAKSVTSHERRNAGNFAPGLKLGSNRGPAPSGSLLLSQVVLQDEGSMARILHKNIANSVPILNASVSKQVLEVQPTRKLREGVVGQKMNVSEGAARLKALSALMASLRDFQDKAASHDAGRIVQAGLPQIQSLLDGFAELKLNPPATLMSRIPATAELKGELVTRLGGLTGRFEVANISSMVEVPVEKAHLHEQRVHRCGSEYSEASIPLKNLGAPGIRTFNVVRSFSARSWHAPKLGERQSPPLPPDDWLESGDREHKIFVPFVAKFLSHVAANGDDALANQNPRDSTKMRASPFWGHRTPKVSLEDYCARIAKFCACSSGTFLLAVTSRNVYRLLLTALLLATKQWDDHHYNNAFWAKAGGIPNAELNTLENSLAMALNWRLHVDKPEFDHYEQLAVQVARSLGCSPLNQTMSPAPDAPVPAPCSGAETASVPGSLANRLAGAGTRPMAEDDAYCQPLSGRLSPPPALRPALRPAQHSFTTRGDESDDTVRPEHNNLAGAHETNARTWSCSPLESYAPPMDGEFVSSGKELDGICDDASSPTVAHRPTSEANQAGAKNSSGAAKVVVDDRGMEFDMQVLYERLQRLKESRLFLRAPAETAVASEIQIPSSLSKIQQTARPTGPLYLALNRMQSGKGGYSSSARSAGMGSSSSEPTRKQAELWGSISDIIGQEWAGEPRLGMVEGLQPVPAA